MENIIFEKYQGNGNDFILFDSRNNDIYNNYLSKSNIDINEICDRRFGIGADGVIFITESKDNNYARMIIYNSDGTEAEMCGNGIRCLVKYLQMNDSKKNISNEYKIETKAGLKIAKYIDGEISVKMGFPILESQDIPTKIQNKTNTLPYYPFEEKLFKSIGYAVGMGNPHLVFFIDNLDIISITSLGPLFENSKLFPEKTNVHFCQIKNRDNIKVKVWERGSGATLACGTGACAVHVAAYKLGLCNTETIIDLPGGNLKIKWADNNSEVLMTGKAKKVFSGKLQLNI